MTPGIEGATAAYDLGDHFLMDHPQHGMVPVFKEGLPDAEHMIVRKMAHGGGVGAPDPEVSNRPVEWQPDKVEDSQQPTETPPPVPEVETTGSGIATTRAPAPGTTVVSPDGTVTINHRPAEPPVPPPPAPVVAAPAAPVIDVAGIQARSAARFAAENQPPQPTGSDIVQPPPPVEPYRSALLGPDGQPVIGPPIASTATAAPVTSPIIHEGQALQTPTPVKPPPGLPGVPSFDKDLKNLDASTRASTLREADANAAIATANQQHLQDKAQILKDFSDDLKDRLVQSDARQRELQKAVMTDIDPQRIFKQAGGFNSTLALIGLGLGTFGAAWSKTPNYAQEVFSKAIENDIRAQERNQQKNIDLLNLNARQRQQLVDEHRVKVADALDGVSAIMQVEANKQAPGLIRENALQQANGVTQKSLALRHEVALNNAKFGIERRVADLNFRQQQMAIQAQAFQHNLVAEPLGLPLWDPATGQPQVGAGGQTHPGHLSPALAAAGVPPLVVPSLVQKAIHDVGDYGVIVKEPIRDAAGYPLVNPATGQVQYEEKQRVLQDKTQRPEVLKKIAFLQEVQEPVSELAALIRQYPEGAILDRAGIEKAQALGTRISSVLTKEETGGNRLSDVDVGLNHQLTGDLGVINAGLGKTPVRVEQLQHTLDSGWRSTDALVFPDKWVQALYGGGH